MKPKTQRKTGALNALITISVLLPITSRTALAQEGIFTMAATEPSTGVWMFREQVQYTSLSRDPTPLDREVNEVRSHTMLAYGLRPDVSVSMMLPFVHRDIDSSIAGESDTESGMDDLMLMGHWRFYQNHSGPIDTTRMSVMGGIKVPTGSDDITADTVEPIIGTVFTLVRGRHGGNISLQYEFNTGGFDFPVRGGDGQDDSIHYDASYLYRIAPARYTGDTSGAFYTTLELNGLYETNGDNEVLISPGVMYEGQNFALELGIQLPAWQELDHRPKTDFTIALGVRFLF
jgi:hypothetical protein